MLLSLFKETEDVYHLKELERVANKEKGLAINVVKETLQRLVDDNQVEEGKILYIEWSILWIYPMDLMVKFYGSYGQFYGFNSMDSILWIQFYGVNPMDSIL